MSRSAGAASTAGSSSCGAAASLGISSITNITSGATALTATLTTASAWRSSPRPSANAAGICRTFSRTFSTATTGTRRSRRCFCASSTATPPATATSAPCSRSTISNSRGSITPTSSATFSVSTAWPRRAISFCGTTESASTISPELSATPTASRPSARRTPRRSARRISARDCRISSCGGTIFSPAS